MLIIENGTVVTPDGTLRGSVAVERGRIAAVGSLTPSPGDERMDADGCYVLPGFIDAHTHLDMGTGPLRTADDFLTGSRAALRGGTTAILDFATQEPGGSLRDALDRWKEKAAGKCRCDYGFHMAVTDWNDRVRAEIPAMMAAGVTGFKLYMAYNALMLDDAALLDALYCFADCGALVSVHCENGGAIDTLSWRLLQAGERSPAAHPKSRPPEVEAEAVHRLLTLARLAGCPVHIVHLSSALALAEANRARASGQTVYLETCPQYLLLDESRYSLPDFEGAKFVLSPPLRSREDVQALGEALVQGTIDTISTDHCSFRFDGQKTLGLADFTGIPSGIPGIEHRAELIYTHFVQSGRLSLGHFVRLLSENPARLNGLYPRKGAITVGADADLVVWNPNAEHRITAAEQLQNTDYTPYEGARVRGRAEHVLLAGRTVVQGGRVTTETAGSFLERGLSQPSATITGG